MTMHTHQAILGTALVTLVTGAAPAATYVIGADLQPAVDDGRIVTDAYDDATFSPVTDVRHFGYRLGRSSGNPYFTADPGFNAVVGSGLPAGQQLRFDVVRHLARWDGLGTVRFLPVAGGEALQYTFGGASATVAGAGDDVPGFLISNVASGGSLHRHLNATLLGGVTNAPRAGLYFTCMRLSVSGGGVARSDAIYIAYNNGLADADFLRGMAYLASPIPGDANFDASVSFDDLLALAQNYSANTDASWFDGDFNGDRAVGFDDLLALAQHYGAGTANIAGLASDDSMFVSDWALARSLVPEPTLAALSTPVLMFLKRRRRD